ncbi:MAG: class I SAM-dependent rRNA methyltransferase [Saprospiraceae bacterium]|nr:class I SAM-dependent rRNA methyltransferase [Saprospiraceae bacterium]
MKKITLKSKRDASVRRFHPWVFSGAIAKEEAGIEDGEWVEVRSQKGDLLGMGHYQDGSIKVRILSFTSVDPELAFWKERMQKALEYRLRLGFQAAGPTNCFRLIHGEGDGLSGLIIDIYHRTAVIQCHTIGMYRNRAFIAEALQSLQGWELDTIFDKSVDSLPVEYATGRKNEFLLGQGKDDIVLENGHRFHVNWVQGQKTGFFLDQRDNRQLLGRYATGKKILNAFCYSGGFSIYALAAGAERVDSVDISAKAMQLTDANVELLESPSLQHQSITADVLKFLKDPGQQYDLMVVDPPAFAKSVKKRHNAVQAYKRLNASAIRQLPPGGLLFTFSCSQVVDKPLFYNTIVAAGLEAKRQIKVMHHLSQPADHPVNLFHPEGSYLKGLVVFVE